MSKQTDSILFATIFPTEARKMKKSMRQFIKDNREEIDQAIDRVRNRGRNTPIEHDRYNDNDRREWIMNDEGLYVWAKSEGVRV